MNTITATVIGENDDQDGRKTKLNKLDLCCPMNSGDGGKIFICTVQYDSHYPSHFLGT